MTLEKNRGREEIRTVLVFAAPEHLREKWMGLQCFIQVHRSVRYRGKLTEETAYFISSLPLAVPATVFGTGIRGHWRIENSLHYVKDVTMKEDASKTRTKGTSQNN